VVRELSTPPVPRVAGTQLWMVANAAGLPAADQSVREAIIDIKQLALANW
jgi:hypothetical protein